MLPPLPTPVLGFELDDPLELLPPRTPLDPAPPTLPPRVLV